MRRKYLRADLARDLGLSPSSVTKLAHRGMPTGSREAAVAWRKANLDASWTKATPPPAVGGGVDFAKELHLGLIRRFALNAERDFDRWAQPLRDALLQLPVRHWSEVELEEDLWARLVDERAMAMLQEGENALTQEDRAAPIPPEHEFICDHWPYLLACGLLSLRDPVGQ